MGNHEELEVYYDRIQEYCLEYYKGSDEKNVWEMANDLMDLDLSLIHIYDVHTDR